MKTVIWGDSLTYGVGDSAGLGWVGRLRNSYKPEENAEVYNRGVCKHTTNDILARFSAEAASIEPEKIIFAVGCDDAKYPLRQETNKVSVDSYRENLLHLVKEAKIYGADIFMVAIANVNEEALRSTTRYINADIDRYNTVLKGVCDAEKLTFISMHSVLERTDYVDGLHPNAEGYQKMYEKIAAAAK